MKRGKEDYKQFVEKFFPESYITQNKDRELIYSRVCENNVVTEIIRKYILGNNIQSEIIFLDKYREQFNKLLIYIAVNESSCIEFGMRSLIEYLLKFIYSMYYNESIAFISKTSFRNIKDDLRLINENGIYINNDKLEVILNYYGKYSNFIHGKSEMEDLNLDYIGNIIKTNNYKLSKLDEGLMNILDCYEVIMSEILNFEENPLSSAELVRLKNTLSNKRFLKVTTYFQK